MAALSGEAIIRLWERGQRRHPVERALLVLAAVAPDSSLPALAALSIGQRDAHLLTIYEQTFGPHLEGLVVCPACQATLEFPLQVSNLRVEIEATQPVYELVSETYWLRFRLPNSFDLVTIARQADATLPVARSLIIERCLLSATRSGTAITAAELPEAVITALAAEMSRLDSQAEIVLTFTCPVCEYGWQALLDILTFLWTKITARAKHLMHEVHVLAAAYGWPEADILALSASRRQFYLDRVSG